MKKTFFLLLPTLLLGRPIDWEESQFTRGGGTACTAIALDAASHILSMEKPIDEFDATDLESIINSGVSKFHRKKASGFYACQEVLDWKKHPEIKPLQIRDRDDQSIADSLLGTLQRSTNPIFEYRTLKPVVDTLMDSPQPACAVITHTGETYALCQKDGQLIFVDSHRTSNNDSGSHAFTGSPQELLEHFENHNRLFSPEEELKRYKKFSNKDFATFEIIQSLWNGMTKSANYDATFVTRTDMDSAPLISPLPVPAEALPELRPSSPWLRPWLPKRTAGLADALEVETKQNPPAKRSWSRYLPSAPAATIAIDQYRK